MLLKPVVEKLTDTVAEMQSSVEFFSAKCDSLLTLVTTNKKEIIDLQAEVGALRASVSDPALQLQRIQTDQNDTEQYRHLQNIEIHGLTGGVSEDLRNILTDLVEKLELREFRPSDVLSVYRLPSKKDKIPDVIVRFASVAIKERWMTARGKLHSLQQDGLLPRLFFNENLTRKNTELLWTTRNRGKEKK